MQNEVYLCIQTSDHELMHLFRQNTFILYSIFVSTMPFKLDLLHYIGMYHRQPDIHCAFVAVAYTIGLNKQATRHTLDLNWKRQRDGNHETRQYYNILCQYYRVASKGSNWGLACSTFHTRICLQKSSLFVLWLYSGHKNLVFFMLNITPRSYEPAFPQTVMKFLLDKAKMRELMLSEV